MTAPQTMDNNTPNTTVYKTRPKTIEIGDEVEIRNLRTSTDYNGKVGKVIKVKPQDQVNGQRYEVELRDRQYEVDGRLKIVGVKSNNLFKVRK